MDNGGAFPHVNPDHTIEPEPATGGRVELGDIPRPIRRVNPPRIPKRFLDASLANFDVNASGTQWRDQLQQALAAVTSWLDRAANGDGAQLAIIGKPGTGKSHLLYAAVNALASANKAVYARPWYRLADELRYGGRSPWNNDGPTLEPHDLRALLHRTSIVAIDEVCATAGTAFDESELGKFVKNAWDEDVAVLITTNVNPLSTLMGEAAADRFITVTLTAPSRRQAL